MSVQLSGSQEKFSSGGQEARQWQPSIASNSYSG
jgi:hypothetical protein